MSADLQSIAASGWSAELIPEDDILQSQFSDVLGQIEKDRTRIAELEGLFAASDEEDAEEDESENGGESGVLPKAMGKSLKDEKKKLAGELRGLKKNLKVYQRDLTRKRMKVRIAVSWFPGNRTLTKNASVQAKASEMEHAIRKHCTVHFNEDPALYKRLSEKLEALLQQYKDNLKVVSEQSAALMLKDGYFCL